MAGDWIKVRIDLPHDPAVIAISKKIGLSPEHVIGLLVKVWGWANTHLVDGRAVSVFCPDINRIVGEPHFAEAMISVGWLEEKPSGIVFPRFDRHNSKSAKDRALDSSRKASDRVRKMSGSKPEKKRTREEKRREEITDASASVPPAEKPTTRQPDEIWNAVAARWYAGNVIPSQRKAVGRIVQDFKDLGATPAEILARADRVAAAWGAEKCTARSLVSHWGQFAHSFTANGQPEMTAEEIEEAFS